MVKLAGICVSNVEKNFEELIGLVGRVFANGLENWVQSQVKSYQRLLKWYWLPHCLALCNIRYVSRVKWCNPGKKVAPSSTPQCSSY